MSVLVLGATGFMGPGVVRALEAAGPEVIGASRSGAGPHGVRLDRRDVAGVAALAAERRVVAVVDIVAFTEADTLPLLEAMDGRVGRWVMASSCDVYASYGGLTGKEAPPPFMGPITEDSPLRAGAHPYRGPRRRPADAPDAWMDDYDKIPLEAALHARPGLGGVVMRLPMVFGPGDRQHRFAWLIGPMTRGDEVLKVDPAWAGWLMTYAYVADISHALAIAATHPAVAGRTFNLGEPHPVDNRGWVDRFAEATGWGGEVVLEPSEGMWNSLDLRYPFHIDTSAWREATGWSEPTPQAEALAATIESEKRA
jgi:nucleoside-diphosphate-sugar epimerase